MKLQFRITDILKKYYLASCFLSIIICTSHVALGNSNGNTSPPSARRCPISFTDHSDLESQTYELADIAYQIKQRASNLFHTPKSKTDRWTAEMERLENRLLQLLENDRVGEIDFKLIRDLLKKREWQIHQEEQLAHTQPPKQKPNGKDITWDTLVEDPTLVQPNHPYTIQFANNSFSHHIIFHQRIVDRFFNKERVYDEKLARKFLTTIRKGFINNREAEQLSGIRRLDLNKSNRQNDIIEVRTIGDISGHVRLGGFLIDNTIYISDFFKASNHTRIATERFANRLLHQLNTQLETQESIPSHF